MVVGTIGLCGQRSGAALPSPVFAPTPARGAGGDLASAKKHYKGGQTKFQAGDFAGALADFQIANDIKETAQAQRYIGRCLDAMGQYPEAIAWYEKFLAHVPEKMRAQGERTRARVAEIRANGAPSGPPDPAPADTRALAPKPADGTSSPGAAPTEPGAGNIDTNDIHPPPPPPPSSRSSGSVGAPIDVSQISAPPHRPEQHDARPRSRLAAFLTAGAALAAAGAGTAFGIIALGDKARLDAHDTPQNAATRNAHALLSEVAFGSAFALGGASLVLFVMDAGDQGPELEPTATNPPKKMGFADAARPGSVTLAPFIAPHEGGAGVFVRF